MVRSLLLIAFFCSTYATTLAQIQLAETEVDTATLVSGLDVPWEIIYGPDDHIWITERYGIVSRLNPATGEISSVLDIPYVVYASGEAGLLGMVLHPDFSTSPFVYLAYTYYSEGSIKERVVRYEYIDGYLEGEFILIDDIPGNTTHNGCRLLITPDYKLLVTTGDAQNQAAPQNLDHLSGKILRLNLDGSIPADNPWEGSPVYSYGHRNPQGLCYGPFDVLYSSEHGPSTDDELNVIQAGQNYGWPVVHGYCDLPEEMDFCEAYNVVEPVAAWTPTIATSDLVYYDHPAIPEFNGSLLMTTLKNKRLYAIGLDDAGQIFNVEQYFNNTWGRLRDICIGPDGEIYMATNGPDWGNSQPYSHKIIKVWNPEYTTSVNGSAETASGINIFPNPAAGKVQVSTGRHLLGEAWQLYNSTGQLVRQGVFLSEQQTIELEGLDPGIYVFTTALTGHAAIREKVVVSQ